MDIYQQIMRDEGNRPRPYMDCCGEFWRDCTCEPKFRGHLSIGIGRNLEDNGVVPSEAFAMFQNDVTTAKKELSAHLAWTDTLDDARYAVFVNLVFNMGVGRLLGFKRMLAAARSANWNEAAKELLDSRYAEQVGARAVRLAEQLKTGLWQ